MHHGTIARTDLHRFHPLILCKVCRNRKILIVDDAARRHVEFLRHLKHGVRLGNTPTLCELSRLRRIGGVAFGRARIDPRDQRLPIAGGERRIVREFSIVRIGVPGRHLSAQHGASNGFRPRPRLSKGQQRHRRRFAGTVAVLAMLLENRLNIFVKRRRLFWNRGVKPERRLPLRGTHACHRHPRTENRLNAPTWYHAASVEDVARELPFTWVLVIGYNIDSPCFPGTFFCELPTAPKQCYVSDMKHLADSMKLVPMAMRLVPVALLTMTVAGSADEGMWT